MPILQSQILSDQPWETFFEGKVNIAMSGQIVDATLVPLAGITP